jgi:hypothetical protein
LHDFSSTSDGDIDEYKELDPGKSVQRAGAISVKTALRGFGSEGEDIFAAFQMPKSDLMIRLAGMPLEAVFVLLVDLAKVVAVHDDGLAHLI